MSCSPAASGEMKTVVTRTRRRTRREGLRAGVALFSAAVSQTDSGIATDAGYGDEGPGEGRRRADGTMASITNMPISRAIDLLSRCKHNRQLESEIVRLGRKGRTDDALGLYRAVWTVELLRSRLDDANNKTKTGDSPPILTAEQARFVKGCKIRPTTRLMNSAIDACARSRPARQDTAFAIFDHATSKYADGGPPGESLEKDANGNARRRERKKGGALSPNVYTFGSLLASCARNGDVTKSKEILKLLESDDAYYPDVHPNGVIYSTVISACERRDGGPDVDTALDVLNRGMKKLHDGGGDGSRPAASSMGVVGFNAALSAVARDARWEMAVQLLGEMILHSSSDGGEGLLSRSEPSYSPLESIRDNIAARPILRVLKDYPDIPVPRPDGVTFGTVLAACERSERWRTLLDVAKAATVYGTGLDGMALTSAMHACQQLGLADEALHYLEAMKGLGERDGDGGIATSSGPTSARNTNGRKREGARQALRGPDGVAYRLAISACARSPDGRWRDGIRLLDEMDELASSLESAGRKRAASDLRPDVVAYTAAIAGCSVAGEYARAIRLISRMRGEGVKPNVVTFSAVINACATATSNLARAYEERSGGGDGLAAAATTLDELRVPMDRALRLLAAMRSEGSSVRPNVVTYNAAIRACAEGLNPRGAFDLLDQLRDDGLRPTIVTYGSLMTACERVGDIEGASRVFRAIRAEDGMDANEIVYGAAISCCRKAGEAERALLLLRKMIGEGLSPNTATFNTVVAALAEACGTEGGGGGGAADSDGSAPYWEKALAVYRVMTSKHAPADVSPNRQTYNILVRCLSSNLQPSLAESVLAAMRRSGLVPDVDLYTLTVRSYERCGSPIKALSLMDSMREDGYDFYGNRLFDEAFKSGVRVLSRVGKSLHAGDEDCEEQDEPGFLDGGEEIWTG